MFCPECGTWNRATAAECIRCRIALPELTGQAFERPDESISKLRRATGTRYRVVKRLASGGMAEVFFAEQAQLGRPVVIKVLHQHLAKDEEVAERFRREAEASAQLVHPHIVPILDYGAVEDAVYTVMPYLAGGSLADQVVRERKVEATAAASAIAQVACALDYAHRRGVVHRDVKPDNILFDEDGNAYLTDFGIATARMHGRLTASGRAMGTPHYMSPEQAMGKLVDGRSDVYAIGIVLYEAIIGAPPFDGADSFAVGYKQVHEKAVPPHEVDAKVPVGLSAIVMRCLAKPPGDRYARGFELADALVTWLAGVRPEGANQYRAAFSALKQKLTPVKAS